MSAIAAVVVLLINDCLVEFGPGGAVQNLTTGFERHHRSTLSIVNLSSQVPEQEIHSLLSPLGDPTIQRNIQRRRATLHFQTASAATHAQQALDGILVGRSRIEVTFDHSEDEEWIEDGILLEWDTCHTSAIAQFATPEDATDALRLNHSMFQARKLSISRPDDDRDHSILIENLPVNVDVDDLATFCMANVVTIIREPAFEEEDGNSMKAFVQGQHGCSTLHIALLPAGENQGAAWIAISGRDRRAKICSRLNGLRPVFLGGCKVTARQAQAFGCRMNAPHLHAIQPQLDSMAWESVYTLTGAETPAGSHHLLRLISASNESLSSAVKEVREIVYGAVWKGEDGVVVWDDWFWTSRGQAFAIAVCQEVHGLVTIDHTRRCIRLLGDLGTQYRLIGALQEWKKTSTRVRTVSCSKKLLEHFIEHSLPLVQHVVEDIQVNPSEQTMSFIGNNSAKHLVNLTLAQCKSERAIPHDPRSTCPICTYDVFDPFLLQCGHVYCVDCIVHMLTSVTGLPAHCIKQDCTHIIPLSTIQILLDSQQFLAFLRSSFKAHLDERPEIYHHCPTRDCTQIYRTPSVPISAPPTPVDGPRTPEIQCPSCLLVICPSCRTAAHPPITCVEQATAQAQQREERLFSTYRTNAGVKSCPSCYRPVEKTEGCSHIECPMCGTHYCWECLQTFGGNDAARDVYRHIRMEHGLLGGREEEDLIRMIENIVRIGF
jgi:hypothetical protein